MARNKNSALNGAMLALLEQSEFAGNLGKESQYSEMDTSFFDVPPEKPATKKPSKKKAAVKRDSSTAKADDKYITRLIRPEKISPWKFADRPESEFGDWDTFVRSIATDGVEIPIIVRSKGKDTFEVVAGRRRWKACLELDKDVPCQVRDITDSKAASLQHLENYQRSDLSAWANAVSWNKLLNEGVFKSQSALAVAMGVDRRVISNSMAYCRIDPILIEAIASLSNVGFKMAILLDQLSNEPSNIPKLVLIADQIRENAISVAKVKAICHSDSVKEETRTVRIKGVKAFTVRKDSNGTPTISFRKEMLERLSLYQIESLIIKGSEDEF